VVDAVRYAELAEAMRQAASTEDETTAAAKAAEVAEVYAATTLNLDRCILLVMALAERQLTVGRCSQCQAVILLDPLGAKRSLCVSCERQPFPLAAVSTDPEAATLSDGAPGIEGGGRRGKQQSLF
jgi:hypothetical protein